MAAAGGQGLAADLAPPRVAYVPAFTWAGIYAGAHLGYNLNDPELVTSSFTTFAASGITLENAARCR